MTEFTEFFQIYEKARKAGFARRGRQRTAKGKVRGGAERCTQTNKTATCSRAVHNDSSTASPAIDKIRSFGVENDAWRKA